MSRSSHPIASSKSSTEKSGLDSLKQQFSSSLGILCELFPSWHEDDLVAVLADLNGDFDLAFHRISEGHADQWSMTGVKKVPKKETYPKPKSFKPASSIPMGPKEPVPKPQPSNNVSRPLEPPPPKISSAQLTASPAEDKTSKTSPQQTQLLVNNEVKSLEPALQQLAIEDARPESNGPSTAGTAKSAVPQPKRYSSINSGKSKDSRDKITSKSLTPSRPQETAESTSESENFVVKLPNMSGIRLLAPEIELSPVILPVTLSSSTSMHFGQSLQKNRLVFGEAKNPQKMSGSTEDAFVSSCKPLAGVYTTTSIDALPSPIASPQVPINAFSGQIHQYSLSSVNGDAAYPQTNSSPPGLMSSASNASAFPPYMSNSANASSNNNAANSGRGPHQQTYSGRSNQQSFDQIETGRPLHANPNIPMQYAYPNAAASSQRHYDQFAQHSSRYEAPFNSRFVPYSQPSIDESFGSSHYARNTQASYYPLMYGGNESYGGTTFTPPSARYQSGGAHHYGAQQYSTYSPSANASHQQAYQTAATQSSRSPSRMF